MKKTTTTTTNRGIQREFILGDSWIYFKIYTGHKTADKILTDIIRPIAYQLIEQKIIDKWFFIRYGDPKYHLRIRFHLTKLENIFPVINSFYPHFNKYLNLDLIWKIQTDTYKREVERYGISSMCLSEELFYHDSKLNVDFLNLIKGSEDEDIRWLFSLKSIDSLLNSFKYNDEGKNELLLVLSSSFKKEFNSSKHLVKQLSSKYRNKQKIIEEFLIDSGSNSNQSTIKDLLKEKEKKIDNIVVEILKLNTDGDLDLSISQLMSSYIHMLMNRLFKSRNRVHELVCYDFLSRYYKSKLARGKFNKDV